MLLEGMHRNVKQQWKSLSSPAGTLGSGPPLFIHPEWSEFLQVRLKAPGRPPLSLVWLSSAGLLSPGQLAMTTVTGLFVLIKQTAKAITAYREGNC